MSSGSDGDRGPADVTFAARANETFTGRSLSVDYVLEGNGRKYVGKTDRDPIQVPTGAYTLRIGMNAGNQASTDALVPAVYEGFTISASREFTTDLASYSTLFSSIQLGNIDPRWVIEVYRGRGNQGINQVWRNQPTKFVLADPSNVLGAHANARSNPDFDKVLAGFESVNQYSGGFLRVPSKDEIEIVSANRRVSDAVRGEFLVNILPTAALEAEVRVNNEIVTSFAQGPTRASAGLALQSEMLSSVQGGDSESDGYSNNGMRNRPMNDLDRVWGDFNYNRRSPGDRILPSGDATPSPFSFPVEFRTK
ncbi:MAG: hypothetical protein U0Q55_02820 [Vicinamibacterales bacterium]